MPTATAAKPAKPKRGPTGYHAQKDPAKFIQPLNQDMQRIVERYVHGEDIFQLSRELGITDEALRLRIKAYCLSGKADKSYQDLVTEALVMRIAYADERLHKADTTLELGIAREQCRFSRMDFERRRPHLYGQRAEITVTGPAAVFLGLSEAAASLLAAPTHDPLMIEAKAESAVTD